jgi:hypothetical protein
MTAGAPTKYKPEYCEQIIAFFAVDPSKTIIEVITGKNFEKETEKQIPNIFPTFEKFAHSIDVNGDTLVEWTKDEEKYPGFSAAYKKAKELQKNFLIQNGLVGLYPAAAFCFVAKNCTDMRDKTEVEHTGLPEPPKELTVRIAKD